MASILKVDTITGVSTAGSIAVTGEGNSTTTNLQQGLAKAWVNFNGTGTIAARDSNNVSSLTDNGTGDYAYAISSVFTNTNYAASVTGRQGGYIGGFYHSGSSASSTRVFVASDSGSAIDGDVVACGNLGDLA